MSNVKSSGKKYKKTQTRLHSVCESTEGIYLCHGGYLLIADCVFVPVRFWIVSLLRTCSAKLKCEEFLRLLLSLTLSDFQGVFLFDIFTNFPGSNSWILRGKKIWYIYGTGISESVQFRAVWSDSRELLTPAAGMCSTECHSIESVSICLLILLPGSQLQVAQGGSQRSSAGEGRPSSPPHGGLSACWECKYISQ